VVRSPAGNRYILSEAGTIPAGGSETLEFTAESPGAAYSDGAGQISELVTAVAGLTVTNAAPMFSPVSLNGVSTGTVVPSAGVTPAPRTVVILITASGQAAAATFSYSLDGAAFVAAGVVPAGTYALPGGITLTFADGAVNPSFISGDRYLFTTPGSPIVTQGRDAETDIALRARCRSRWGALSLVPTEDKYSLWAQEASTQVTKVTVSPSNSVAGQVDVVIAGAVNPLGGPVVTAVQTYLDERAGITDLPVVVAANAQTITTFGNVYVKSTEIAAVQEAAQLAWNLYIATLPIGGIVRVAELAQALMDAGAVDYSSLLLNAAPTNYELTSTQVAATLSTLESTLGWIPV
jgi:hypothetical protein